MKIDRLNLLCMVITPSVGERGCSEKCTLLERNGRLPWLTFHLHSRATCATTSATFPNIQLDIRSHFRPRLASCAEARKDGGFEIPSLALVQHIKRSGYFLEQPSPKSLQQCKQLREAALRHSAGINWHV